MVAGFDFVDFHAAVFAASDIVDRFERLAIEGFRTNAVYKVFNICKVTKTSLLGRYFGRTIQVQYFNANFSATFGGAGSQHDVRSRSDVICEKTQRGRPA